MKTARLLAFLLIAATTFLCSGNTEASIVAPFQNGNFASGTNPPAGDFNTLYAGSNNITGWSIPYGSIDWIYKYWNAPTVNGYSIDLSGNSAGAIQQTFATTADQIYKVSFFMAGNPDSPGAKNLLAAVFGGIDPILNYYSFDSTGKARTNMGWIPYDFTFTAAGSSATLLFQSLTGSSPYGPAIANVDVSAVPLPAAAWLLGTGLVGLVAIKRRRK